MWLILHLYQHGIKKCFLKIHDKELKSLNRFTKTQKEESMKKNKENVK